MAEPFLAEVRIMSFNFAPKGWAQCFGQAMPINQNQALFSLLGTQFGGDGRVSFNLPNLQARIPLSFGQGFMIGQAAGEDRHNLTQGEMPAHSHFVNADGTPPSSNSPTATSFLAGSAPQNLWGAPTALQPMDGQLISNAGGSQPHENRMPFLALNFCIALVGIFPTPN